MKRDLRHDYELLKKDGWWARFLSNHDKPRQVSLYGNDTTFREVSAKCWHPTSIRSQELLFVFQGEELGMTNVAYPSIEDYDDIDTKNAYHTMLEQGIASRKSTGRSSTNQSR